MTPIRTIIVRPANPPAPLPDKKKPHWIAIFISAVSFLISIISFFFSTLLETDDLRMVIEHTPQVYIDDFSGEVAINGSVGLAFVNSGNRSASIMRVKASSRRAKINEGIEAKCPDSMFDGYWFNFGVEPFVLKSGDIFDVNSKTLTGAALTATKGDHDNYRLSKAIFSPKAGDVILLCAEANFVTLDNLILAWRRPILRYEFINDPDVGLTVNEVALYETQKPIILVYRNKWFGKLTAALHP